MDTLSCTAEPKLSMIRLKVNKLETTRSAAQSSLIVTTNEEDLTLGLKTLRISISNPDTEIKATRHLFDKMASTRLDSIVKRDEVVLVLGPMDPITVSKLNMTLTLDQRILILSTTETLHRPTTCIHLTQFI